MSTGPPDRIVGRDVELSAIDDLMAATPLAGGLTNREVAAIAYIRPKTVEVNLSRIYRKLGVRNRTEPAKVVADRSQPVLVAGRAGDSGRNRPL
jgi:hypothetical protein